MAVQIPHLSKTNIIVISCCVAITLAVVALGPFLQVQQKNRLDRKIADSQKKSEVLAKATELHQVLQERISGLQTETGPQPITVKPLSPDQPDQVLDDLNLLAFESGVVLADIQPDLESMRQDSKTMLIETTVYGTMSGFQTMLNALLKKPYVDQLQRMLVSVEPEGLQFETDFTVHIK
jgi:hypothetical protein